MIKENQIIEEGYLIKQGSNWKTWRKRYFRLYSNGELTYQKKNTDLKIIKTLTINNCLIKDVNINGRDNCILLEDLEININLLVNFSSLEEKLIWEKKFIEVGSKLDKNDETKIEKKTTIEDNEIEEMIKKYEIKKEGIVLI
jgi:hypothetical protein